MEQMRANSPPPILFDKKQRGMGYTMTLICRFAPYIRSSLNYHLAKTTTKESRSDVLAYSEDIVYPLKPHADIDHVVIICRDISDVVIIVRNPITDTSVTGESVLRRPLPVGLFDKQNIHLFIYG